MKSEESKIGLGEMYLGACILAASNGGNIRRALYQAEELANLCEQDWENRLRQLERQHIRSAVECAGIRKNWSLGIQHITGETRRDRAESKFIEYCRSAGFTENIMLRCGVEHPKTGIQIPVGRGLNDWREQGFVDEELDYLKKDFEQFKELALRAKSDKSGRSPVKPLPFH